MMKRRFRIARVFVLFCFVFCFLSSFVLFCFVLFVFFSFQMSTKMKCAFQK